MFSRQNGIESAQISDGLLERLLRLMGKLPFVEITPDEFNTYGYILRKLAHLFIYFLLGFLSCQSVWALFGKRYISIPFCFCALYACTDELHQRFSAGRNAALIDVLIDSGGAFAGIMFMTLIICCLRKIERDKGVPCLRD